MFSIILKQLRVKHWVKNFFVYLPIIFSGDLLDYSILQKTTLVFISFCFISGAVYCFNDIIDIEKDKQHSSKKNRPLPSGKLTKNSVLLMSFLLILFSLVLSYIINFSAFLIILTYLIINISFSTFLKDLQVLDVMAISSGFVLRMFSGTTVVSSPPSHWIFLTTMFLSLFLGFSKRRTELAKNLEAGIEVSKTRKVLQKYSITSLDHILVMLMSVTIVFYSLYTTSEDAVSKFGFDLVYTVPLVLYGMLYFYLGVKRNDIDEDPTDALLGSVPIILVAILWALIFISALYL